MSVRRSISKLHYDVSEAYKKVTDKWLCILELTFKMVTNSKIPSEKSTSAFCMHHPLKMLSDCNNKVIGTYS